jgi:hypothetical protein
MLFAALFAGGSQSVVKPAAASSGTFVEDEPTSQMACPRSGDSPNSIVPAQQRAATTQTPAEAHRRWRGERSEPVRLGVRSHTHALFAREVQRKLSNGIAGFAALGSWRQATAALARTRPQHHSHDVFGNARRVGAASQRHASRGRSGIGSNGGTDHAIDVKHHRLLGCRNGRPKRKSRSNKRGDHAPMPERR